MLYSEELKIEPFPLLLSSDAFLPTEVLTAPSCPAVPSLDGKGEGSHGLSPILPWDVQG